MENRGGSEELQFGGGERAAQPTYQEATPGVGEGSSNHSVTEMPESNTVDDSSQTESPRPVNLPTVPEVEPTGQDFDPAMVEKYDVTTLEAILNDAMSNNSKSQDD